MASQSAVEHPDEHYEWLEEVEGDAPLEWVRGRNAKSKALLETELQQSLESRLRSIFDSSDRIPYIAKRKEHAYNFWQDKNNERGVWRRTTFDEYVQKGIGGEKEGEEVEWEVVLDLDVLSAEEGVEWVWHGASFLPPDYRYCLLSLSRGGSDADVTREFDVVEKKFVPHENGGSGWYMPESKGSASWIDRDTLMVATDFGEGSLTDSGYPRSVREWKRGQPLSEARVIFEGEASDVSVRGGKSFVEGFEHEVIRRSITFYSSEVFLRRDGALVKLPIQDDAEVRVWREFAFVELRSEWNFGGASYQKGSLLVLDLDSLLAGSAADDDTWQAGVAVNVLFEPTERSALQSYTFTKSSIVLDVLENVRTKLKRVWRRDGEWIEVPFEGLPEFASISASALESLESDDLLLTITDFVTPTTLSWYRCGADAASSELVKLRSLPAFWDASGLEVSQHVVENKNDGTIIPYFEVSRKHEGARPITPTLLYGYGGFEISLTPYYSATNGVGWLERGGTYVLANIRGGGEFGPKWHQAALKENRTKAYQDMIAVGQDLVARGVTTPEQLGVMGGSNGGLLVGNMLTMQPDLFGAIVCQVPLLDMKRYHKLLAGASWMGEYGNPDTDDWDFIKTFSPFHNVKPDVKYPPILFTTSTRDDRVHPAHARKMVSRMEDQGHDVLYYENIEGGHGGASTNAQRAYVSSLVMTFLAQKLKLQ